MKCFLSVCLMIAVCASVHAQANKDKILYSKKTVTYHKMKCIGIVATALGTAAIIAGTITSNNSNVVTTSSGAYGYPQSTNTGNPLTGMVEILSGAAVVGLGVPLWIVGGINHKKYQRKLNGVSLNLNVSPGKAGLRLTYRF